MYGPSLPIDGLSGQLWIGSGFGDDTLVRGGLVSSAQGELGCSDVPGWTERGEQVTTERHDGNKAGTKESSTAAGASSSKAKSGPKDVGDFDMAPDEEDGTDDHLHYPLRGLPLLRGKKTQDDQTSDSQNAPEHADIQALQESAEISGKVVLLSRGGCGFLEKTKWVQRRGGIALIVGDYNRGNPLRSMYANGDTSNVTIPSIFTAYTSAHLLSSLVPPEGSGDGSNGDGGKKGQDEQDANKKPGKKTTVEKPAFTPEAALPKATSLARQGSSSSADQSAAKSRSKSSSADGSNWLNSLAANFGLVKRNEKALHTDTRRPPSSGRISWIQSDDWDDDPKTGNVIDKKTFKTEEIAAAKQAGQLDTKDNFVIGVHDWRDADLVAQVNDGGTTSTQQGGTLTSTSSSAVPTKSNQLSGGSRAPGSGVYGNLNLENSFKHVEENSFPRNRKVPKVPPKEEASWFKSLFRGSKPGEDPVKDSEKAEDMYRKKIAPHFVQDQEFEDGDSNKPVEHEGLWVTMTPTSISTSPFFDTLLVLVVSPMVTLTVVYALLLLRSRIRRRRWRAPRSVVDRLPVRTYHTMSFSSSSTSSETSSPGTSSPSSPLLQSGSKSGLSRTRPRSRTMSTIRQNIVRQDAADSLERATANLSSSSAEKSNAFKRKYSRKQVECVVCLEEYIDGQSRVMSLPCGHEFHAECM